MTRLALLSDIHANLPALEAAVADIDRWAPDGVYVLGDLINGCAWPVETLDLLTALGWPMLMGNHDDAVLQLDTSHMEPRFADRGLYPTLWWTRERLAPRHLALIDGFPRELVLQTDRAPAVRLMHGLPGNPLAGFRPDSPEDWALRHLAGVPEPTVAGGHTHVPMVRQFGRWQVVNSGSVGAPYDGDLRASYVVLDSTSDGWRVTVRRIDYDRERTEQGYHASGLDVDGGVMGEVFHRGVMTAQPWVSDFIWWVRQQQPALQADPRAALAAYDAQYGPGRWAFPLPR